MKFAKGKLLGLAICCCAFVFLATMGDARAAKRATTRTTAAPAGKTGAFDITFTQRSPLSEYSKLLQRTGATKDELGPDYKLAQEPFAAYVPPDYNKSKPIGLIVQSSQYGTAEILEPWHAVLDAHHLMIVAAKQGDLSLGANTGVCLDAVYNVQQSYNVDPARIYLIGSSKNIAPVGLCTGDLFTGDAYGGSFDFFAPLVGGTAPAFKYQPSKDLLQQAKAHVQVLAFDADPSQEPAHNAMVAALKSAGFDRVVVASFAHDELKTAEGFEKLLKVLESGKSAGLAAASQPVNDEPVRLLHLAQAYLGSGFPDRARQKLNLLIQKYPNDPAAAKAKELLEQINNQ
jgi:hypothetical protein